MGGDTIFYIFIVVMFLIMMEIPQFIYISTKKLIHMLDEPALIRPKLCRGCGKIMSCCVFRIKKDKNGKVVWLKYKCIYCGMIHKVMK